MLKLGGNKKLIDLLGVYKVDKSCDKFKLYYSKLLDFHRRSIKADLKGESQPVAPDFNNCMDNYDDDNKKIEYPSLSDVNTSTTKNYEEINNNNSVAIEEESKEENPSGLNSYLNTFKSAVGSAYGKTKDLAHNVKDKVSEMKIGTKVKEGGSKAFEAIKNTTSKVVEKGEQVAVLLFLIY